MHLELVADDPAKPPRAAPTLAYIQRLSFVAWVLGRRTAETAALLARACLSLDRDAEGAD